MYPSTNPFAYGNQPLSILEDNQMIATDQHTSISAITDTFEFPAGNRRRFNIPFENFNISALGSLPQPGTYGPQRHDGISIPREHGTSVQMTSSTAAQDAGNTNTFAGFWQQIDRGRTGLTPGVNLDDLFGADGGWNPGYMDQGYGRTQ